MEQYIKDNLSDITYVSELIPPRSCIAGGLIRTITYVHLLLRKLCAH